MINAVSTQPLSVKFIYCEKFTEFKKYILLSFDISRWCQNFWALIKNKICWKGFTIFADIVILNMLEPYLEDTQRLADTNFICISFMKLILEKEVFWGQQNMEATFSKWPLTLFPLGRDTFITLLVYHVTKPSGSTQCYFRIFSHKRISTL